MTEAELTNALSSDAGVLGAVVGALLGVVIFIGIIGIAIAILTIIGQWKSFNKAGERGWAAIIPVYNVWVAMKVALFKWYHFVIVIVLVILANIPKMPEWIMCICVLAAVVYSIVIIVKFCKAFGKSNGFCVMAVFFPFIAYMIIGCGKAKYIGNKK